MKIHRLSSYALGIAAALITLPGYAALQSSPQSIQLFSANAQLTHRLNSNTARMGETVMAKLTSNVKTNESLNLPKGTMLLGKVDQVQSDNSSGGSKIALVFNQARLNSGRTIAIKATILGAYPPAPYYSIGGSSSYLPPQPRVIPSDQKVLQEAGTLHHIAMRSSVNGNVSAVFISKDHNIDLQRGTRLQLGIAPQTMSGSTSSGT